MRPIRHGERYYKSGRCGKCPRQITYSRTGLCSSCVKEGLGKGYFIHKGYRWVKQGEKFRQEHRLVAERSLDRELSEAEVVHHLNRNGLDNRPENLLVVSRSWHKKIHSAIGASTRYKKIHYLDTSDIVGKHRKLGSWQRVASVLGCSTKTIERHLKGVEA